MIKGKGNHWHKALREVLPGVSCIPVCLALFHRTVTSNVALIMSAPAGGPLMAAAADKIKAKHLSLAPAGLKEPSLLQLPPQSVLAASDATVDHRQA